MSQVSKRNPRFIKVNRRNTLDERDKNALNKQVRQAFDDIIGSSRNEGGVRVKGLRSSFDITGKRFESTVKGKLKQNLGGDRIIILPQMGIGGEDCRPGEDCKRPIFRRPPDISFKLDVLAKGRSILAKKGKKTAKEFNAKRIEGFLRIRDDDSGKTLAAVAFNFRTITPIKLVREAFRGDFEAIFAKVDQNRSRLSGSRRFSGIGITALNDLDDGGDILDNSLSLLT